MTNKSQSLRTAAIALLGLTLLSSTFIQCANSTQAEVPNEIEKRANAYPGYELVFAQEFSEDGFPDSTIWKYENGYCRNHEDQYYIQNPQNPNAFVKDGVLVIEAREESLPNKHYVEGSQDWRSLKGENTRWTSASMQSKANECGGYSWRYGIYEVRAKIPAYEGAWPAIWSTGMQYNWPYGGEIDLMEWYDNKILSNVCWGNGKPFGAEWNSKTISRDSLDKVWGEGWQEKFHTWKMVWNPDTMELWVDSILVNKIDLETTVNKRCDNPALEIAAGVNPFRDVRQMIWLNLALGGDNGGPLDNTPFPCRYLIDYVRVYQKPGVDGHATVKIDSIISEPKFNVPDGVSL